MGRGIIIRLFTVVVVAAVVLTLGGAGPVMAQSGPEIEISAGIGGYVSTDQAVVLDVDISSDVLFVGTLEIEATTALVAVPVEIPAEGKKRFTVQIDLGTARRVDVSLIPRDSEESVSTASVPLRRAEDEVLVGVLGAPVAERTLDSARTTPVGQPVIPLQIMTEDLGQDLSVLHYLVAGPDAFSEITAEAERAVAGWVENGGRLIGPQVPFLTPGVVVAGLEEIPSGRYGRGEIMIVDDPDGIPIDVWNKIIRDVPGTLGSVGFAQEPGFELIQAAGRQQADTIVPKIGWLLAALLAYLMVVGPINFLVLIRLGRRELAWVTIPTISLITVATFWLAGPRSSERGHIVHASVLAEGIGSPSATSSLIMLAGVEGYHTFDVPADWSVFPIDAGWFGEFGVPMGGTTGAFEGIELNADGQSLGFDLDALEAATLRGTWSPGLSGITGDLTVDDGSVSLNVRNDGSYSFWAWGVGYGRWSNASTVELSGSEEATLRISLDSNVDPWSTPMVDSVFQSDFQSDIGDPWSILYPLGNTASRLHNDAFARSAYFFGYTFDVEPLLGVDGDRIVAEGPALVIVFFPLDDDDLAQVGVAMAEVVAADGADFIENAGGAGRVFIGRAEAVYVRFMVPPTVDPRLEVNLGFGPDAGEPSIWDWDAADFVDVSFGQDIDPALISPTGEIMVRLVPASEFGEMMPTAVSVEWDVPQ